MLKDLTKRNKILLAISIFFVYILSASLTYAYFNIFVEGNENANDQTVTTGTLELNYVDGNQLFIDRAYPGASVTKNMYVTNTGTLDTTYGFELDDYENTILRNELVISLTCTSYKNYGEVNQEVYGTCNSIVNQPIGSTSWVIASNIDIEAGITHSYVVTVSFIDTSSNQNYNQGKYFTGTIKIYESLASAVASNYVDFGDYVLYDAGSFDETVPLQGEEDYFVFGGTTAGRSRSAGIDCTNDLALLGETNTNWRVLKNENNVITLVHAGTPECYRNHDDGALDSSNLINRDYSDYVNPAYATSAGILTKELIEANVLNAEVVLDGGFYDSYQNILKAGTRYFIPFPNPGNLQQMHYVQPGGYIGAMGTATYGIRPVVTLKSKVYVTSGTGTSDDPYVIGTESIEQDLTNQNGLFTGYYENWNTNESNMKLRNVSTAYNIVAVMGHVEDDGGPTGNIVFEVDEYLSNHLGGYTNEEFKRDIQVLNDRGQKVVLVIGGSSENIVVNSAESVNNFVNSLKDIIDEFGFNGIDIDIENTIYPEYLADALQTLADYYGNEFTLILTPQTDDMKLDENNSYTGVLNGTYYDLIQEVKDEITIVNMQLYNTGDKYGLDGNVYDPGTIDFIAAYADIMVEAGLDASQVGLGFFYDSTRSGYVTPQTITAAYNAIKQGGTISGGTYTMRHDLSGIGGIMFFSIQDDMKANYIFRNEIKELLK